MSRPLAASIVGVLKVAPPLNWHHSSRLKCDEVKKQEKDHGVAIVTEFEEDEVKTEDEALEEIFTHKVEHHWGEAMDSIIQVF